MLDGERVDNYTVAFVEVVPLIISLDKQVIQIQCADCGDDFTCIRGNVYDDGRPFGLYLIALHGHSPKGRLAHLAISIVQDEGEVPNPIAAAMDVISMSNQFGLSLVDWDSSPWKSEGYLGNRLDANMVRSSPHQATFFHVADHIVDEIAEVQGYFAS